MLVHVRIPLEFHAFLDPKSHFPESSFLHEMPFENRVSGIVSSPSDRPFTDYSLRVRPYDMMQGTDGERIQVLSAWAHGPDRPHHTLERERRPSAQFPTH